MDMKHLMEAYADWLNNPDAMYEKAIKELDVMVLHGHIDPVNEYKVREETREFRDHCKRMNSEGWF